MVSDFTLKMFYSDEGYVYIFWIEGLLLQGKKKYTPNSFIVFCSILVLGWHGHRL